jgi:hypothetical protein
MLTSDKCVTSPMRGIVDLSCVVSGNEGGMVGSGLQEGFWVHALLKPCPVCLYDLNRTVHDGLRSADACMCKSVLLTVHLPSLVCWICCITAAEIVLHHLEVKPMRCCMASELLCPRS